MAHYVLKDSKIWLSKYDISGDLNKWNVAQTVDEIDNKTFDGTGFKARIAGLRDVSISVAGLVELTDEGQDEIFSAQVTALSNTPITIAPAGATVANRCKFGLIQTGSYQSGGNVGGRAEFSAEGKCSSHEFIEGGQIMSVGLKTGTFNGTAYQLGAVTATQKLYGILHVTVETVNDLSGVIFKLQSDDNEGFSSAADRMTFSTVTGITSEFPTPISGAITDTWWRFICSQWTAGTSAYIVASAGIQ